MSIWNRITEALSAMARGEPLSTFLGRLRRPPERSVAFTIAVIALGAKMAKADGRVSRNEVAAFREVFALAPGDEEAAGRVFNLARQDVAGYEDYARRVRDMFRDEPSVLCDLLDGLFHISMADGTYHAGEDAFLERVATIFGLGAQEFSRLRARHVPEAARDPFDVLGLPPGATLDEARQAWHHEVRECHPDRLTGRGLPAEAVRLAEKRLVAVNGAWKEIQARFAHEAPLTPP